MASETYWEEEVAFCESEGRKDYPMLSFDGYCAMQAQFAWRDGFTGIAERIARAAGLRIDEASHAAWQARLDIEAKAILETMK